MPTWRAATLLALLGLSLAACSGGGSDGGDGVHASPRLWVGARDAARIDRLDGSGATAIAAPPTIDAPVRALLPLRDAEVLVLQEPEACDGGTMDAGGGCVPANAPRRAVPPGVFLDAGYATRDRALAAVDPAGAGTLFTHAAPPWAAAQDPQGRIWVTGRTAPVVYREDGAFALDPQHVATLLSATRGVAALPDGRVAVSFGVQSIAVYRADGTVADSFDADLGPDLGGLDALLARGDGTLLVASRRFGVTSAGVVVAARLDPGALALLVDPALSATVGVGIPSALGDADGTLFTAPALGRLSAPECARWLSGDLRTESGCVAPGPHRGAGWVR